MARLKPSRRLMAALAAVALASVATFALMSYVNDVRNQALADVEQVEVLVAKDTIAADTTVEQATAGGLIAREAAPRQLVADDAVRSLDEIEGLAATVDIFAGEPLLRSRFASAQETDALLEIPEGYQAMSVAVATPPGAAGFVQPGDTVSIIASVDRPRIPAEDNQADGEAQAGTAQRTVDDPFVKYLLHNVQVLSVGQRVVVQTEENEQGEQVQHSQERVLATLAVTPVQAEKLGFAVMHGDLYLTLVPEDQQPVDTPGRTRDNVFDSEE